MAILRVLDVEARAALESLAAGPAPWSAGPGGSCEARRVATCGLEILVARRIVAEPLPILRFEALSEPTWVVWMPAGVPPGRPVEVELSGEPDDLDGALAALVPALSAAA